MDPDLEVPSFFTCPITMELMKDPVIVSTGITYDRESIEHWVYTCKKKTCPATMQELQNLEFTPNHMLRRLIQGWCVANSARGVDRIPTPRPPIDPAKVTEMVTTALECPPLQAIAALKKLRSVAWENQQNRRCIVASVPAHALVSILHSHYEEEMEMEIYEQVLGILNLLPMTKEAASLLSKPPAMKSMALVLRRSSSQARLYAITLLQTVVGQIPDWEVVIKRDGDILQRIVEIMKDKVCNQATVASLDVLMAICARSRRNQVMAVDAGAVYVLVEMLAEVESRLTCDKILEVADKLLECAEGRAAFADHAMGVAVVSKKMMRVSDSGTRKAVRILWSLSVFHPSASVLRDMIRFGAVSKLCLLLQLDCSSKTKQKAKEMLKLHGKSWSTSPCFPLHFKQYFDY